MMNKDISSLNYAFPTTLHLGLGEEVGEDLLVCVSIFYSRYYCAEDNTKYDEEWLIFLRDRDGMMLALGGHIEEMLLKIGKRKFKKMYKHLFITENI